MEIIVEPLLQILSAAILLAFDAFERKRTGKPQLATYLHESLLAKQREQWVTIAEPRVT